MWSRIEQHLFFQRHTAILQFIRFGTIGFSGAILDFGLFTLLTRWFHIYYLIATAISVFTTICYNFFWNKFWVFKRGQSGKGKIEYTKFVITSVGNYFLNLGITYYIVEHTKAEVIFGSNEDYFAKVVAIAIVLFSNYFAYKYWAFRD